MSDVKLGRADYHRDVPKEGRIQTRNRYFEQNPSLTDTQVALIARPGMRRWITVGLGPIRGVYSQPGSFNDSLFVVSGNEWYRVDKDATVTLLTIGVNPTGGAVSMVATGFIGVTPEFMFMADGRNLWLYTSNGFSRNTISGSPADTDTVKIGSIYYKFTTGAVDTGTPAGTLLMPWLVKKDLVVANSWLNFYAAVNASGTAGTQYSTLTTANPVVSAYAVAPTAVSVHARVAGPSGDGTPTTVTGAAIAWTTPTTTGGGTPSVTTVKTPDDIGVISLGYIASYVVAIPAQGNGINGRFWWINPGETTIDPLDYATAERSPDPVYSVIVFGDQFWLPGQSTTEVWYFTGNFLSPVLRLQGVTFDRGSWEGAAVQVKESMIIVDDDGGVFQISGGLKRISDPSIEERIRVAIQYQASHT